MQPLHTFIVGSVAEIKLFIDAAIDIDASTVGMYMHTKGTI